MKTFRLSDQSDGPTGNTPTEPSEVNINIGTNLESIAVDSSAKTCVQQNDCEGQKIKEEEERKAKEEADRLAKQEADRLVEEEEERKAKEEAVNLPNEHSSMRSRSMKKNGRIAQSRSEPIMPQFPVSKNKKASWNKKKKTNQTILRLFFAASVCVWVFTFYNSQHPTMYTPNISFDYFGNLNSS